jgi:hypothetical protein
MSEEDRKKGEEPKEILGPKDQNNKRKRKSRKWMKRIRKWLML